MPSQDLIILDALQAGILIAIAACFGADGFHRRDQRMGWIAVACLLMALLYTASLFEAYRILEPGLALRARSLLACLGFLAMVRALVLVLPGSFPKGFLAWLAMGLAPNLARVAFLPLDRLPAELIYYLMDATYCFGCLAAVVVVSRASLAGDPMGRRLFLGVTLAVVPVLSEILADVVMHVRLPLSGLAIMVMAVTLGVSWLWFITQDLQSEAERSRREAALWRNLVPGITWRTGERSPLMERLFGPAWEGEMGERAKGLDGIEYLVHKATLGEGREQGWLEVATLAGPQPGESFLAGWRVALGMDEGEDCDRVVGYLKAWGAKVEWWGTVPPREGPYPSILIWAREPSILAVWREDDLARRKARWIQVGGADIEGPHFRLERPLGPEALRQVLQRLLSFRD